MIDWIDASGHLNWIVFSMLVYTGIGILLADYLWRRITMSAVVLAAIVLLVWIGGIIVIANLS